MKPRQEKGWLHTPEVRMRALEEGFFLATCLEGTMTVMGLAIAPQGVYRRIDNCS